MAESTPVQYLFEAEPDIERLIRVVSEVLKDVPLQQVRAYLCLCAESHAWKGQGATLECVLAMLSH